jgi:PhnB protein
MSHKPQLSNLNPIIISSDAKTAIVTYKEALGAEVMNVLSCPQSGKVLHACLNLEGCTFFVSDTFETEECVEAGKKAPGGQQFYLLVADAEEAFKQAKDGGFTAVRDPEDTFWGHRVGTLKDRDGNTWSLGQQLRNVSPEEMEEALRKMTKAA